MMNKVTLNGRIVRCGRTPVMLRLCGFRNPSEVANAVRKFGTVVSPMRVDDVANRFDEVYGHEGA